MTDKPRPTTTSRLMALILPTWLVVVLTSLLTGTGLLVLGSIYGSWHALAGGAVLLAAGYSGTKRLLTMASGQASMASAVSSVDRLAQLASMIGAKVNQTGAN